MTSQLLEKYFAERAVPASRPPPPTGVKIISKSDCFSNNSFAEVLCPRITWSSLDGWIKVAFSFLTILYASISLAFMLDLHSTIIPW